MDCFCAAPCSHGALLPRKMRHLALRRASDWLRTWRHSRRGAPWRARARQTRSESGHSAARAGDFSIGSRPCEHTSASVRKRKEHRMEIRRCGSQSSVKPSPDYFIGTVRQDPIIEAPAPSQVRAVSVTFEPGARTAWHTHPLGQTLVVTSGCGRAQARGGPMQEIRAGDVVWFSPGEEHWHGASPATAMTHIAIQEALDGKAVDWLQHVSDEQYSSK